MSTKIWAIILASLLLVSAVFVILMTNDDNDDKETIYVTMSWQNEMVQEICGDEYDVRSFLSPGEDPHGVSLTPGKIVSASSSFVYFAIGSGVEWEMENINVIKENVSGMKIIECCSLIDMELLEGHSHDDDDDDDDDDHDHEHEHSTDPHVWSSPVYLREIANVVKDTLCELRPDDSDTFIKGADSYISKVNELADLADKGLSGKNGAEILIWHPSWAYLFHDYGITENGLQESVSGSTTPSSVIGTIITGTSENDRKDLYVQSAAVLPMTQDQLESSNIYVNIIELDPLAVDWLSELEKAIKTFSERIPATE